MRRLFACAVAAAAVSACSTPRQQPAPQSDGTSLAGSPATSGIVTRRVWADSSVGFSGSPSPDGRYISFTDWNTGDLAVRDLATGLNRRVTNKGTWSDSADYAETSSIAPDGHRIAFVWYHDREQKYQLRLTDLDGAPARVLIASDDIEYFGPPAWSPDGRDIAVGLFRSDRSWQLAVVSAQTGALRVLRSFDWRGPWKLSYSTDGGFIAYDFPPEEESPARDVYVIAADGSREARVIHHPAHDQIVGWSPDGRDLFFFSNRDNTEGLWALPVAGGRADGQAALLRRDLWHFSGLGSSRDAYFYGVTVEAATLQIASLDVERAQLLNGPGPLPGRPGSVRSGDWSPDGRSLAYFPRRGGGRPVLAIQSLESGEVREIPVALDRVGFGRVAWTPDGSAVVVNGQHRGRQGIYRIDLMGGRTEPLVPSQGGNAYQPELAPDGRTLFFLRYPANREDSGGRRLVARDLRTGIERILCSCLAMSVAVSPDGQAVAFSTGGDRRTGLSQTIRVMPVSGGDGRVVYESRAPETLAIINTLQWSRDGRNLLFVRGRDEPGGRHELMTISVAGGEARKILDAPMIINLRLHPDGRRLVWGGGQFRGEVWVMENLPAASGTGTSSARN